MGRRARGVERQRQPFLPPEDWYPPEDDRSGYDIVERPAGNGFAHVVTPQEIRDRLEELPGWMLEPLQVVQLSRMTRKKCTAPCYGMQWGATIYLYPLEEGLTETFSKPPTPAQRIEAKMYGARWRRDGSQWLLCWTRQSASDYYLHNVLIHELGHLLDRRNQSFGDRERYAEWFAIEYGYRRGLLRRRRRAR